MLSLLCLLLTCAVSETLEATRADRQWLADNRDPAFQALMPFSGIVQPTATYRSYQDHYYKVPERYFSIRGGPRALEAVVISPVGRSVQQQMLEMHVEDRSASLEPILARVRLDRAVIAESQCPGLRRRLRKLPKVDTKPKDWSQIVLHAPQHLVRIEARGATIEVLANDDHDPTAQWAIRMFAELRECANAKGHTARAAVEQGLAADGRRDGDE